VSVCFIFTKSLSLVQQPLLSDARAVSLDTTPPSLEKRRWTRGL